MSRSVRKTDLLIVFALINAGCAQMSGTYVAGNSAGAGATDWPVPTVDNSLAPIPAEPTVLPWREIPAERQATPEPKRSGNTTRRAAVKPRAVAVPSQTATATSSQTLAVTTPPRNVWERVRNGFQMRPVDSDLVRDWENYYSSRQDYFARMIDNSGHFLYHIANEVERRGMPLEIALLPMIESAYNPVAYSSAHASGIWQFIPSTGKNYGLKQNLWYDGRRDVIAATGAALDYLQTLHRMFNDWELALAAYNWGEGAVQRAIDKNLAKGLPVDYLSLAATMPAETRNYVPKLMAVKNIIANPARFGLTLAHVPNEPYFEIVTVRRHIDVTLAARFSGMSVDEFKFLNPAHNKPVINSDSSETIVLPRRNVSLFTTNMELHTDKPLVSMKTHHVRAGERPESIAAQYGISVSELNSLNGIGGRRHIATGQTLVVPNRTDLQPVLADIPVATSLIAAATRPVYQRNNVTHKVVVTRGGVRRTVVVTAPVQRANARIPLKHQAVVIKPGARKVTYAKPVVKIRN